MATFTRALASHGCHLEAHCAGRLVGQRKEAQVNFCCRFQFSHKSQFSSQRLSERGWTWKSPQTKFGVMSVVMRAAMTDDFKGESEALTETEAEELLERQPLVVCFGEALSEFVPCVRINDEPRQDDTEIINTWKSVQWSPPEFARTPGGPSSNVAIALGRLNGRVGFMGKIGDDRSGRELVKIMEENFVMTDGIVMDKLLQTGISDVRLVVKDGHLAMTSERLTAGASMVFGDFDRELLEEATILHVTTLSLLSEPSRSAVIAAVKVAKDQGALIVLDVNLPLPLWRSLETAWSTLLPVWQEADVVKVTRVELEFLINEAYFERRREAAKLNPSENDQAKGLGNPIHYTKDEVSPVFTPNLQLLLVTNGTWSVHYYTHTFDGLVRGTEDVIVAAYSCDRTGSGDAVMAGFLRKLSTNYEILENEDKLQRALRFAISAGIITQWTPGVVKSLPTESAAQNMTEQVYNLALV